MLSLNFFPQKFFLAPSGQKFLNYLSNLAQLNRARATPQGTVCPHSLKSLQQQSHGAGLLQGDS
jgi:hypothetical protein